MRTALLATLLLVGMGSIACTKAPAPRELVERQVNQRLDRQLHSTLQKLLGSKTAQVDASMASAGFLTRR